MSKFKVMLITLKIKYIYVLNYELPMCLSCTPGSGAAGYRKLLLLFKIKPWAAKEKSMLPGQFKQECPELISSTVT